MGEAKREEDGAGVVTKISDVIKMVKLRPREVTVLNGAIFSVVQFGIPDFLPAQDKASRNAAQRLIEKGYLSNGKAKMTPDHGWMVVRFTEKNRLKLLRDAGAVQ